MDVLFVNSCLRPKGISRTYALANHFVNVYEAQNPKHNISRLDLSTERITPLTNYDIDMRKKSMWSKAHHAQQFLRSNKVIIAAPVWNMSYPAVLKVYIEYICLPGTTFEHTKDGYIGLCAEKKVIYISTMGGIRTQGDIAEAEYMQAIFTRLGIVDYKYICAEGLDIKGNDADRLLKDTMNQCEIIAKDW